MTYKEVDKKYIYKYNLGYMGTIFEKMRLEK